MFDETQRQHLRDLSKIRKDKDYPVAPNIRLEDYIDQLKRQHPELFQTKESLQDRVFMDQPMSGAYKRYVRTYAESPLRIVPVSR
jgi:hypothetical protein